MSGERFTLVTNILFYHVDTGAGQRHERALQIVERAVATDCWLPLQSVSEFYAAVTRNGVVAPARAAAVANDWLKAFPTAAPSASAVRAALATAAAGQASYWDAMLVVTAAEAGCTAILTEDLADGSILHGVRVLNPFADSEIPPQVRALLTAD
jgi:predicted nucleic acid-binding protein